MKMNTNDDNKYTMLARSLTVKNLISQIDECDKMIDMWKRSLRELELGYTSEDEVEDLLALATEALKDKKSFEAEIGILSLGISKDMKLEG